MEYKGKGVIQRSAKQILHKGTKRSPTQPKKLGQALMWRRSRPIKQTTRRRRCRGSPGCGRTLAGAPDHRLALVGSWLGLDLYHVSAQPNFFCLVGLLLIPLCKVCFTLLQIAPYVLKMINSPKLMEYVSVRPYLLSLVSCLSGFYIIVGGKNVS